MADQHDLLMREVDEELRKEQFAKLWEKYGTYMIGAAAAIVLGVGGYKWNEARSIAAAEATGARFEAATSLATEGKTDDALKALAEIAKSGPAGYALLAELRTAGALAKAGKTAEAVTAFEAAAARGSVDPMLADYARLQAATLKSDSADWTEMQNRLNDLIGDAKPWRHAARELLGVSALKAGKLDEARKVFEPLLVDRNVPATISERARIMMNMIASAELAKGAAAPAAPAPNAPPKSN